MHLILSDHILGEVEQTLTKPYFARRLTVAESHAAVAHLRRFATITPISVEIRGVATHPEDDLVLATAVSGGAQYLVSGDGGLQQVRRYRDVAIVSPREFLGMLEADASPRADSEPPES
ncbi:MAG: putative toxin-antitoxin system toxin component, PIN family [Chloroflexi bacterium]|nr:putative toxin-antitoxin system toxin component, PIN family [Chloroflexota bacterium]